LSPAEAEGSKEIFGKLNGVPDTRKKAKITCMILCFLMHDLLYTILSLDVQADWYMIARNGLKGIADPN